MRKITLTRGKVALVDNADFDWLNQFYWCATYVHTTQGGHWYAMSYGPYGQDGGGALMHRLIMSEPKGRMVDPSQ